MKTTTNRFSQCTARQGCQYCLLLSNKCMYVFNALYCCQLTLYAEWRSWRSQSYAVFVFSKSESHTQSELRLQRSSVTVIIMLYTEYISIDWLHFAVFWLSYKVRGVQKWNGPPLYHSVVEIVRRTPAVDEKVWCFWSVSLSRLCFGYNETLLSIMIFKTIWCLCIGEGF